MGAIASLLTSWMVAVVSRIVHFLSCSSSLEQQKREGKVNTAELHMGFLEYSPRSWRETTFLWSGGATYSYTVGTQSLMMFLAHHLLHLAAGGHKTQNWGLHHAGKSVDSDGDDFEGLGNEILGLSDFKTVHYTSCGHIWLHVLWAPLWISEPIEPYR